MVFDMGLVTVKSYIRRACQSVAQLFFSVLDVSPIYGYTLIGKEGYHCYVGYYDHDPVNSDSGLLLYHRVAALHSKEIEPPEGEICVYSVEDRIERCIATTRALNWQLASRAQWLSGSFIIFNDIEGGFHCSKILDVDNGSVIKTFQRPIWAVSRDKTIGASLNFSRISSKRPGYGYRGESIDESEEILTLFSLSNGEVIYSMTLRSMLERLGFLDLLDSDAYMNHIAWSYSATKFLTIFHIEETQHSPRMVYPVVIDSAKDTIDLIHSSGFFSHHVWLSDDRLLAYIELDGKRCYALWHESRGWQKVAKSMPLYDGHPSPIRGTDKVVVDGYADRLGRMPLYVASVDGWSAPKKVAMVKCPVSYSGALRCDLHPRVSADNKLVICDVPFSQGRMIMILEGVLDAG